MKTKAYIGNCPNCGRECMSGLKTTLCWNCETEFTIPTDMQEISYVNSTSIESKGCDNEQEPCEDAVSRQAAICKIANSFYAASVVNADFEECEKMAHMMIDDIPPVTPQPKTDALEKIRAEIETKYGQCDICEYFENYDYEENDISEYRPIGNIADILQIIDKYRDRAESEGEE